jgi:hypothetical protein
MVISDFGQFAHQLSTKWGGRDVIGEVSMELDVKGPVGQKFLRQRFHNHVICWFWLWLRVLAF